MLERYLTEATEAASRYMGNGEMGKLYETIRRVVENGDPSQGYLLALGLGFFAGGLVTGAAIGLAIRRKKEAAQRDRE